MAHSPIKFVLSRLGWWWNHISPPTIFVLSFILLIAVGTTGLMVLPNLYTGPSLTFLDALFTMTSAVCVTGLAVVDTATYFTFWGQLWILLFIQLGGLGLISLTTLVIAAIGRKLSLRSEVLIAAPVDVGQPKSVVALGVSVLKFTLVAEAVGACVLWLQWLPEFGATEAAWHAVFHAISAFCNAGFSTFSTSMIPFQDQPAILVTVSFLIIFGGIGYLTFEEGLRWLKSRRARRKLRLSLQSTAVVWVTVLLLFSGAVLFAFFEWNGVLAELSPGARIANAWFMSTTARTAGFNSVSYAAVTNASAYLTILLMVVGGSPGSTAGGLKTTTFGVLLALSVARIRGRRYVEFRGRTIPRGTTERTVSLALLAFAVMTVCIFLLLVAETTTPDVAEARQAFLPLFFEVVSAFCTVGLSMDVTPDLGGFGRLLAIVLMFVGRVGPLVFFAAITLQARSRAQTWRHAEEDLIVG